MASITIRNLKDGTKERLRRRAAANGRSLEAEVRDLLDRSATAPQPVKPITGLDIFRPLRDLVDKYGPFELEQLPRTPVRDPFAKDRHHVTGVEEEVQPMRTASKPRRKRK